ncbi:hypothetical protein ACSX1A_14140 [Pontibacter sp. MBLB2868]|uniref:hypothetical protein n=1 Tax=Pontibacter sp. MBLB2868 TaxID=3451555 RepID=UPI003F74C967
MNYLSKGLVVMASAFLIVSCSSSKSKPNSTGKIIIIDGKQVRIANSRHDNGLHKGWYKNPNNPHHPHTTNPGHTKHKKKGNGKKED